MIKIENLSIRFDDRYLFNSLSMEVADGEMVCISGGSGSGKSSLLKSLLGFLPIQEGRIVINGKELTADSSESIRREIGWIPQELSLPFEWVGEMVETPFKIKANRKNAFNKQALFEIFKELGLDTILYDKRVSEISGGQRQRIMIAVSAMLNKKIMILDEPTSALDQDSCRMVVNFLDKIRRKGATIIIVSHDRLLASSCDRVIELNCDNR
ncbi:ATP-binding cassette domain-containing protein [Phocaeicola paurosaccharolyticus]|uniref:ATP-binding cassette domain-containing protein n=1 Tax=Phocaeicola paurosaccharolyticus TaxID=732242 RepID=UPI002FE0E3D9